MRYVKLEQSELNFLENFLSKFRTRKLAIKSLSELDGFLTGISSVPEVVFPSDWLPHMFGGPKNFANWDQNAETQLFIVLSFRHMNHIISTLINNPDQFKALFYESVTEKDQIKVDQWCQGYMNAVRFSNWPELPKPLLSSLEAISLHALPENQEAVSLLSPSEYLRSIALINPAARQLHTYWYEKRLGEALTYTSAKDIPNFN